MRYLDIKQKGMSLIEIVFAIMIFAIFSICIFYVSLDNLRKNSNIEMDSSALMYAQEGIEAVRNVRNKNYLLLENGSYGLKQTEEGWELTEEEENIDGFYSRIITIEDIYRDDNGNISDSGEIDPDTKKITSEVSWHPNQILPKSKILTTYLSNWPGKEWITTTCTEFTEGAYIDTMVVPTSVPPIDNCALQLMTNEAPGNYFGKTDIKDYANDIDVDGDYLYIASHAASKGLSIIDISDIKNIHEETTLNIGNSGYFVTKEGNYLYMGVKDGYNGLAIIDVSDPSKPVKVSQANLQGDYGNRMAVSGNLLFAPIEKYRPSLFIFDISDKTRPAVLSQMAFGHKAHTVTVINDALIYAGLENDHDGIRIVNITNPRVPAEVGKWDDYFEDKDVNSIILNGIFAYVGTEDSINQLKVLNISDPLRPELIKTLDVGGDIHDLVISKNYLYAAVDKSSAGLAAINITNPADPKIAYIQNITGKARGIDADENYVYIALARNDAGAVMVGDATASVQTNGAYISKSFDTESEETQYKFIEWEGYNVPGSSIKIQVRTANTISGLETAAWVGPDGTNSTYYDISRTQIVLDPGRIGNRYFQYKIFMGSDGENTSSIESVKINFNP